MMSAVRPDDFDADDTLTAVLGAMATLRDRFDELSVADRSALIEVVHRRRLDPIPAARERLRFLLP